MSKLTEYLKLIPKGIADAPSLIEGIVNQVKKEFGTLSEEKQQIIAERKVICSYCPFMSENSPTSEEYLELTGHHYQSDRKDKHCSMCGCPINTRTASLSKGCGLKSWNEDNPTKQVPLKWFPYDTKESKN